MHVDIDASLGHKDHKMMKLRNRQKIGIKVSRLWHIHEVGTQTLLRRGMKGKDTGEFF